MKEYELEEIFRKNHPEYCSGDEVEHFDLFLEGYNKANEWSTETPSSAVGNKDLLLRVAKDDFDVGYYHFEKKRFYTNDGREVAPLAWKEILYSQESEK